MRLSIYATIILSATLFEHCSAAPSFRPSPLGDFKSGRKYLEAVKRQDDEVLKYFHEPGNDECLGHHDRRYFHGIVTDKERSDTQTHMIRAYLEFFRKKGMDTWLAHGTLLGWWWNGKRLPWDFDLDTQVSHATLHRLGQMYNQTMYQYTSTDGSTRREFLLDVNPWIWERVRGDGMNVIDARWIDVRNGLFIDITGLSETRPDTQPGVWSCKNYHNYKTEELYPMRETRFEGAVARVPYAYDKILTDEYHHTALINTEFHGHYWDPQLKEWAKSAETLEKDEEERKMRERDRRKAVVERTKLD
ncbi:hypothetical protein CC86DRAFT_467208 [Ophiobolus disseminans]|uniref:LicD/FKTN/FKRP nucleotidyltransferase domain-containing protein n=1 Tax=Ophiobolus disseminans TaxID=1469910 RepID=A0A6A7A165_9PLEO|nr:hypothetical protein CC86DRAFT_467208 [Ophiobolus disseminans]